MIAQNATANHASFFSNNFFVLFLLFIKKTVVVQRGKAFSSCLFSLFHYDQYNWIFMFVVCTFSSHLLNLYAIHKFRYAERARRAPLYTSYILFVSAHHPYTLHDKHCILFYKVILSSPLTWVGVRFFSILSFRFVLRLPFFCTRSHSHRQTHHFNALHSLSSFTW